MYRKTSLSLLAGLAVALYAAVPGQAQITERGRFDVGVGGGVWLAPNSSALVSAAPVIFLQGRGFISENFGIGFAVDYSRTETDGDIFDLGQFRFTTVDSTLLVTMKQPVSLFNYQLIVTGGLPVGESLYPYLTAGIGGYTIYLDPQQNEASVRSTDLLFSVGAALKWLISGSAGLELAVRDLIWTNYDRSMLDPMPDRTCRESGVRQVTGTICPNERFPQLNPQLSDPNWSEPSSTIHNILITATFTFIPGL